MRCETDSQAFLFFFPPPTPPPTTRQRSCRGRVGGECFREFSDASILEFTPHSPPPARQSAPLTGFSLKSSLQSAKLCPCEIRIQNR